MLLVTEQKIKLFFQNQKTVVSIIIKLLIQQFFSLYFLLSSIFTCNWVSKKVNFWWEIRSKDKTKQ